MELGSGTGSHARALSRAGVHRVTGLDMCDEMLTYAIWKSKSEGIDVGAGSGSGSGSLDFIKVGKLLLLPLLSHSSASFVGRHGKF